jgi:DNA-damage-inducible protein D
MQSQFDALARKDADAGEVEFWFARDLQEPLGYARWENFLTAIQRAIDSCRTTGYDPDHHFRSVTKMVPIGSGAGRPIEDFMLIHHGCYLIAGSHFSAQSRKQERIDCALATVRSL